MAVLVLWSYFHWATSVNDSRTPPPTRLGTAGSSHLHEGTLRVPAAVALSLALHVIPYAGLGSAIRQSDVLAATAAPTEIQVEQRSVPALAPRAEPEVKPAAPQAKRSRHASRSTPPTPAAEETAPPSLPAPTPGASATEPTTSTAAAPGPADAPGPTEAPLAVTPAEEAAPSQQAGSTATSGQGAGTCQGGQCKPSPGGASGSLGKTTSGGKGGTGPALEAVPLLRVKPVYPRFAEEHEIEGWVLMRLSISKTGAVVGATVVDAEPRQIFDAAALQAIRKWRYRPTIRDGRAEERHGVMVKMTFQLE